MTRLALMALVMIALLAAGCTHDVSPRSYSVGSVGQLGRTVPATVIDSRVVRIEGTSRIGGVSGAGVGAVTGAGVSSSSSNSIVGAIGGSIVGGLAGAAIERSATDQEGFEYVVETHNGNMMTLVQVDKVPYLPGEKVLVLYGSRSRIIPDPR